MPKKPVRIASFALAAVVALGLLTIVGCVRTSGGVWYFKSAAFPEGWPELTPVGEVQIREYPVYRAATVTRDDAEGGMGPMFGTLFEHIKSNDIAMTAPVDMGYAEQGPADDGAGDTGSSDAMSSMAFLYRTPDLGEPGTDGLVRIDDVEPATYASVGVRGGYSQTNFERGLGLVNAWLESQEDWRPIGPPRYLGYNGPFTPVFWRYGEVQVPVQENAAQDGAVQEPPADGDR
ncbi:MAG: heme-binding protein [Phycisphaerales bacterium]